MKRCRKRLMRSSPSWSMPSSSRGPTGPCGLPEQGGVAVQRASPSLDAHQLLDDGVVAVMKKTLSAEQWTVYQAEKQKRGESRKHAAIRYFVDSVDRELYLSPEQCKRLELALAEHWESTWAMYLENHLVGNKYYPMTVEPLVTPILTEAQKRVWQGVQKVGVYWGIGGMMGNFANDQDGLEVELGVPAKPEQNRNQRSAPWVA